MATCPNGHPSGAEDWCEVCGIRMAPPVGVPGAPVPPPPGPGGGYGYPGPPAGDPTQAAELCPECNTPREGQAQFCEECRFNFVTQSPSPYVPPQPPTAGGGGFSQGFRPQHPQSLGYQPSGPSQIHRGSEPLGPDSGSAPGPAAPPGPPAGAPQPDPRAGGDFMITPPSQSQPPPQQGPPPYEQQPYEQPPYEQSGHGGPQQTGWVAVVTPDREYFTTMMQRSGPEAQGLNLPAYSPEQKVALTGPQITIGRRRQSTGEVPDIDMARPPEDPGVSHKHAMLVEQPDGSWSVVDQNSTNGTTVNGASDPIQPFVPVPLREGDRVHVGAWTTIRLERG